MMFTTLQRSLFLAVFVVVAGVSALRAEAGTYPVDAVHSSVVFRIKYSNIAYFYGRFNEFSGTVTFDPAAPAESRIEFVVRTESVDTNNERRDLHLKGPDFFNSRQYPEMRFVSDSFTHIVDEQYEVKGQLTILDVTREVSFVAEFTGHGQDLRGATRVGAEAIVTIKRSDFGMTYMLDGLSDEVRLILAIQGKLE